MLNFDNARMFLLFLIYSAVGYCCEVIYCSALEKRFVNRGFLHGPVCPVYGFGALLVLFLLEPWSHTWARLFFAAVVITSALEYATSWIMEVLFHTKWWDYSHHKFNIHGRVCLLNSILFGLMAVGAVHFVQPFFAHMLLSLSDSLAKLIAAVLLAVFAADILDTVKTLVNFSAYMARLKEFSEGLKEHYGHESWFRGKTPAEWILSVREQAKLDRSRFNESLLRKLDDFYTRKSRIDSLVYRFPSMRSKPYGLHLDALKERIRQSAEGRRAEKSRNKN